MDRMVEGHRVGVLVHEWTKDGKSVDAKTEGAERVGPRFFGRVIEVANDGQSGYVDLEKRPDDDERYADAGMSEEVAERMRKRVYFHCSELIEAPEPTPAA